MPAAPIFTTSSSRIAIATAVKERVAHLAWGTGDPTWGSGDPPAPPPNATALLAEVGTQIQASSPGSFTARVSAYDSGNTLIGFFDVVGDSNSFPGTAIFIGIRSTLSTNPIYKVDFSIQPGSSQISSFAINRVELSTTFI